MLSRHKKTNPHGMIREGFLLSLKTSYLFFLPDSAAFRTFRNILLRAGI